MSWGPDTRGVFDQGSDVRYITFSNNMELILKLHINCVMLFILNFLITFNPGCAVKFGYNCMLVKSI